jgi:hypothetical protein
MKRDRHDPLGAVECLFDTDECRCQCRGLEGDFGTSLARKDRKVHFNSSTMANTMSLMKQNPIVSPRFEATRPIDGDVRRASA